MDTLYRIDITTSELRQLAPLHAGFFAASCLAINELNLFIRLFLMALNHRVDDQSIADDAMKEYVLSQHIILQRHIGAKLFEYRKLLNAYRNRCDDKGEKSMRPFLKAAVRDIDGCFKGPEYELAEWFRNSATNHYDIDNLADLIATGNLGPDTAEHSIYLHEKLGNSGYLLGEKVLLAKLVEDGRSPQQRVNDFDEWVKIAVQTCLRVHHEFCMVVLHQFFPTKMMDELPINPEPGLVADFQNSRLPVVWAYPKDA